MREKVNAWFENGCNFDEGVGLIASTGKHKHFVTVIKGREKRYTGKLRYELLKLTNMSIPDVNVDFSKDIYSKKSAEISLTGSPSKQEKPVSKNLKQLPPEVEKIIRLHADAFKSRSILHETMSRVTGNNPPAIERRKELSDQILDLSTQIELFWQAKEDFYTKKIVPDIDSILHSFKEPEPEIEVVAMEDISDLKKKKISLQNYNSTFQIQLDYSAKTKQANKNPMPVGPKRLKIENQIKNNILAIQEIDYKLLELTK